MANSPLSTVKFLIDSVGYICSESVKCDNCLLQTLEDELTFSLAEAFKTRAYWSRLVLFVIFSQTLARGFRQCNCMHYNHEMPLTILVFTLWNLNLLKKYSEEYHGKMYIAYMIYQQDKVCKKKCVRAYRHACSNSSHMRLQHVHICVQMRCIGDMGRMHFGLFLKGLYY